MGLVHDTITIKNAGDVSDLRRGFIQEREIRQIKVHAMVDTGTEALIISEAIQQALGLEITGQQPIRLANEGLQLCRFTEPVELHWRDRHTYLPAFVMPGLTEVLMGAIPLESLDLIVDPKNQQLIGEHGDQMYLRIGIY